MTYRYRHPMSRAEWWATFILLTEAMRQYWDSVIAQGRVPKGAELARAAGCDPSYGRRMRREWLDALDGRTRRSLLGPKKVTA